MEIWKWFLAWLLVNALFVVWRILVTEPKVLQPPEITEAEVKKYD